MKESKIERSEELRDFIYLKTLSMSGLSFIDFYNQVEAILQGMGYTQQPTMEQVASMQEEAMNPQEIAVYFAAEWDVD